MRIARWFMVLALCAPPVQRAMATEPPAQKTVDGQHADELDEIVVRGTRLADLQAAVLVAEDRYYARYNELNKVEAFDVSCHEDKATGTLLKHRVCTVRFEDQARWDEGRARVEALQRGGSLHVVEALPVVAARREEYLANARYLLKTHPELLKLSQELDEAQRRYDSEFKRRMKGRLILME